MARLIVAALSDLDAAGGTVVRIDGSRLALFRIGDRVFAIEDRCPHRGFPLNDGVVDGETVRCRTHGACFSLTTGAVVRGPARRAVRVYRTEIIDGQVALVLPDGSPSR